MRFKRELFTSFLAGLLVIALGFAGAMAGDQLQIQHDYSDNIETGAPWLRLEGDLNSHGKTCSE
jgi:hypothetical protein